MAWIESHQELGRHPKTKRAARLLGISQVCVVGHLHYLWWWALDYAQDGNLERYTAEEIADAAMWEGDAGQFVEALRSAGFIDGGESYSIHDWQDTAGKLIDRRRENAERMRRARAEKTTTPLAHDPDTSAERAAHVHSTFNTRAGATEQNRTVPNTTEENTEETSAYADGATSAPVLSAESSPVTQVRSSTPSQKSGTPQKRAKSTGGGHKEQWDALVQVFYQPKTKSECSNFGKVSTELRDAGATGAEILRRAHNHRVMRDSGAIIWDLTLNALSKHWSELAEIKQPRAAPKPTPLPSRYMNDAPVYSQIPRMA